MFGGAYKTPDTNQNNFKECTSFVYVHILSLVLLADDFVAMDMILDLLAITGWFKQAHSDECKSGMAQFCYTDK